LPKTPEEDPLYALCVI